MQEVTHSQDTVLAPPSAFVAFLVGVRAASKSIKAVPGAESSCYYLLLVCPEWETHLHMLGFLVTSIPITC